jgi:predicted DNA-binding transcriptional regulator AlpA
MFKNSDLEIVVGLKARRMTTPRIQYQILWRSPVSVDKNDFRLISRRKVAMRLGVQDYTVRDIEASDPSFPRRRRLVTKEKAAFFYREHAIEEWFARILGIIETA